ncbi:MAG: M3 family metallopeptidase [Granulosicoccaceae bacterium]
MQQLVNRPNFSAIDYSKIEQQLKQLIEACRSVVSTVQDIEVPTWENFIQPQEEAHNNLDNFWSPISHLNAVMNNDELREVYNGCLPTISAFYTELGQNKALYEKTAELKESADFVDLNQAQQQGIKNDLRGFQLGGVALNDKDKKRFSDIAQASSKLKTQFSDNVLDASNAWEKLITDEAELDGLPDSAKAAAKLRAKEKGADGWQLNLDFPVYYAVQTFASNRKLRKELYTAYNTKASDQGPHAGKYDNSSNMQEILKLRAEKAALLNYDSYADLSMVTKMVESPQQVLDFLTDLAKRAKPIATKEMRDVKAFGKAECGIDDLELWDMAFVSDKLKQQNYSISDEDLKPYFPANKVIPGMFDVVGKLFGITIKPAENVDVYHPDVKCYSITDAKGVAHGYFYLDNYARENKRGGAWMDTCTSRQRIGQSVQLPIAYLTCNLTPPVANDPALLTHMEVTTLFHEFGHGLHHMLTQIDSGGVSGIAGVEWDAVELPSQFLENWCWERESIDMISGHYQTGAPLPDDLLDKLRKARNFQSAMQLLRQMEFSIFDMQLHLQSTSAQSADVQAVLDKVRSEVAVVLYPDWLRFQHSFSHIFAGGYSAGYFSYKWAEVLSADAFSRFEDEGIFNAETGASFMNEVLAMGGSRKAMESFIAFRGREPKVDALLRHTGLAA